MANTALNFDDVVKASAKPKTKIAKKKSDKEIISNAPQAVKKAVSNVIKAKAAKKKAESDIKVNETPVIEFGNTLKNERAFNGDYNKSYKIQGLNDDVVTFVTANKFSHKEDDEEEIAEIMGEENFEELMPKAYTIKVKSEVFNDPDLQKELMEKMGDRFNDFFEVESSRKVTENFDEELYKRFDEDIVQDIKVYVKQSKPSIR
jgi:hypothetical protein